jgi:hypothetical protein
LKNGGQSGTEKEYKTIKGRKMKKRTTDKKERKNLFQALCNLLTKKKNAENLTQQQKISILEEALAKFFADHDKVSNEVNLFPLTRAHDEVQKMVKENTLDYHFEWFLLQQEYLRKIAALQAKYNFKKVQA